MSPWSSVASVIASESETVAADANTELTISSEESTNNDGTVAQVPEPATASEATDLAQEPIAEVTAIFPEAAAPVQALETQTEAQTTPAEESIDPVDDPLPVEQTVSVVVQDTVETFTETLTVTDTSTETTDAALTIEPAQISLDEPVNPVEQVVLQVADPTLDVAGSELAAIVEETPVVAVECPTPAETAVADAATISEALAPESNLDEAVASAAVVEEPVSEPVESTTLTTMEVAAPLPIETNELQAEEPVTQATAEAQPESLEAAAQPDRGLADASEHVAYEEYLKDNNQPVNLFQAPTVAETAQIEDQAAAQDPVANIDPSGELRIEMDTKNARVWNELGNVYFNTGAFDDAIIAYSKAIELDRWFAWPYSNLALTYVQKARYAEAILLYQRSIELFSSDKDKAISWNRLGNVYRRMDDYDNAICAYQRADDLDPDNTTLSLQSRFSLLGSYVLEQKPSYAS